ncbi:hypothetical protein D9753_16340 [Streptomyces dangxiongensis]|uniref:Uncharacterized protein n=1 Tax=Streptomyces dangxiongensis TaxID=1442032 RepID=A0A3G2JFS0_9ACTN|nr:hypothetical protein D9753_16340 [Streptomyces dangxiongensis]
MEYSDPAKDLHRDPVVGERRFLEKVRVHGLSEEPRKARRRPDMSAASAYCLVGQRPSVSVSVSFSRTVGVQSGPDGLPG